MGQEDRPKGVEDTNDNEAEMNKCYKRGYEAGYRQGTQDMRNAFGGRYSVAEAREEAGGTREEQTTTGEAVRFRDAEGHAIPFEEALAHGYAQADDGKVGPYKDNPAPCRHAAPKEGWPSWMRRQTSR